MTLDPNMVNTVSIIVIGVLVLVAVLAVVIISKIFTKLLTVVIVLGLAAVVYWQRDEVSNCVQTGQCTFFGQEVEIPENDLVGYSS